MPEALRHSTALALLLGGLLLTMGLAAASGLDDLLDRDAPALLPKERAFAVRLARSDGALVLELDIAPGYYLYRDRLRLEAVSAPAQDVQSTAVKVFATLPAGETLDDESFGQVAVLKGALRVPLALEPSSAVPTAVRVHYQGCAEGRACYSPAVRVITLGEP